MNLDKIRTIYRLGLINVFRVIKYRFKLKLNLHPVQKISADISGGDFFYMPSKLTDVSLDSNLQWDGRYTFFGWKRFEPIDPELAPNWFRNYFSQTDAKELDKDWWKIPDFDSALGDIKCIWEASRFDWVITFAQKASQGDRQALSKLNYWLSDWVEKNPTFKGPNWKCGQEASIRVMHLAMAAHLLKQSHKPSEPLRNLIEAHLQRIYPTLSYAIAQNNNHGTSEAAALFIGGSWLVDQGNKKAGQWEKAGRRWLENRARLLIEEDGSFSQYSVNYHRVMLDTFSMVEVWRQGIHRVKFSQQLYKRLNIASAWLDVFTDKLTGGAPNIGANDGARLLPLTDSDYRDFRPSVQLSSILFREGRAYSEKGHWDLPAKWLGLICNHTINENIKDQKHFFKRGGYVIFEDGLTKLIFRYPNFRFRPSQSDIFHLDLWHKGRNVLRDGGSYSYNISEEVLNYYAGVESHNTVQFGNHNQMPKLSRFLYGNWTELDKLDLKNDQITAAYTDYKGNSHQRSIRKNAQEIVIVDDINLQKETNENRAVLRWRLEPGDWVLNEGVVSNGYISIEIKSNEKISIRLATGHESLYYYKETELSVLVIEALQSAKIATKIIFT